MHLNLPSIAFDSTEEELAGMTSHLVIFTMSTAMYRVYAKNSEEQTMAFAGHSLGEFSALTCAGSMTFQDAIRLVNLRVNLLEKAGREQGGKMMAVRNVSTEKAEKVLGDLREEGYEVYISNYNSPHQFVISASHTALVRADVALRSLKADTLLLPIPTFSHCPLLTSIVEEFKNFLNQIHLSVPTGKVYSNFTGLPYKTTSEIRETLPVHLLQPVLWEQSISVMSNDGIELFIEMGPGEVLKTLNSQMVHDPETLAYDNPTDRFLINSYYNRSHRLGLISQIDNYLLKSIPPGSSDKDLFVNKERYELLSELKHKYLESTGSTEKFRLELKKLIST